MGSRALIEPSRILLGASRALLEPSSSRALIYSLQERFKRLLEPCSSLPKPLNTLLEYSREGNEPSKAFV
jgi:hypothetical protein